jgi:hypothetical protein
MRAAPPQPLRERVGVRNASRLVECRGRMRVVEGARSGGLRDMVISSRVTRSVIMPDIESRARGGARRAPMDETRETRIGAPGGTMSVQNLTLARLLPGG